MGNNQHVLKLAYIREMLAADPDINLYLLAFDCPELEEAALEIASGMEAATARSKTATSTEQRT
jgi:hypothetical protein